MLEKLPDFIGHAVQGQRAGLAKILFNKIDIGVGAGRLAVTSTAFIDHAPIPSRYTADGEGISPPLQWHGIPDGTDTLALIVEDADSPTPEPLVHAVALELDTQLTNLLEGELHDHNVELALKLGRNSFLQQAWLPPDPPPGHGIHRYAFQLFALKPGKPFSDSPGRSELAEAVLQRAIASGCLIGTYERHNTVKSDDRESFERQSPVGSLAT